MLALRAYHLRHGALPATLDELVPEYLGEVPTDPYAQAAFRYEPNADSPRLWSVGRDRQPNAAGAEHPDDIVVELPWGAA